MHKRSLFSIMTVLLIFGLAAAGCGGASVATEAQPADEAEAAVEAPPAEPTQASEEPAPEPIPCNVVFDSDRDGNWEIYIMGPDGENPTNLSNNPADDWDPAISPDGGRIAFVSNRENETGGGQFIYVMNADGSDVQQLTFEENCDSPDWSHDGSMITYTSNEDVFFTDANDGSFSRRTTDSPEKDASPTWSPDGTKIAWLSGSDGNMNVFMAGPEGQDAQQITDTGRINHVRWTNDGRLFVDGWGWQDQEEFCHNCIVDMNGENIQDGGGKGELQRFLPFWNGNGDRVELIEVSLDEGPSEIYLVGEIFPDLFYNMTNDPSWDRNPDWPANCGPDYIPAESSESAAEEPQMEESMEESQEAAVQPMNSEDIVIGYDGDESTVPQKVADLKQACEELGIQCIPGGSISELAEQGVDAIINFANKWSVNGNWPQIHDATQVKGIPLYVLDAESGEPGVYNLAVESDTIRSGMEWMFTEMGGEGEMVYFNFGTNDFEEGLIQLELEKYPGIQATSIPATYEDTSVASEEKIAELVASNPNVGAIWSNEFLAGIFWGLNDLLSNPQPGDNIPLILCENSQGRLQEWKERLEAIPDFKCFTTIKPGGNAYEAVYVAYYRLTGLELDPAALGGENGNTLIYDYPKITSDNLNEWLGKAADFRVGDSGAFQLPPMTPEEIRDKWFLD